MKQPGIRCGDRDPEYLGSLIHRAFLQLIKFDDVSKARTQLCNRLSQGGLVLFFRANLLWIWRESGLAWSRSTLLHQRGGALAELLKRDFQRTKFLRAQFR